MMNRRTTIALSAMALLGVAPLANVALAETASDLAGTSWTLVSLTNEQGGKKTEPFGPNPKGLQVFDGNGRFSIVIVRPDLPKFASNSRDTATADESQKVVHGSIAYFGTYTVNAAEKSFALQVEGATFPNWTGAQQKRTYAISGDVLTISNATPSIGAGVNTITWKRAKQTGSM
jgi:hypothetical protein